MSVLSKEKDSAVSKKDRDILRELGRQIAEIACDPLNDERRAIHAAVCNMEKSRPSITIFEEPWHELNNDGSLDLHCEDDFCREIEQGMRRTIYKWRVYPGDMVVAAESVQKLCINNTGFGIDKDVDIVRTDEDSDVVSRHYHVQIKNEADIHKIKKPVISHDAAKSEELFQKRSEIFDGILKVSKKGENGFWFAPWDRIVEWTGIQEILLDLAMRPDYVHKLVSHLVDCYITELDQLEEMDLLEIPLSEMSVNGAAQIFAEVSPAMHGEFALQYEAKYYKRFKSVHYGCCEPLHNKVDLCAEYLPNMTQISMSPWVDFKTGAENVRDRFIFGWRPNPAFLAHDKWDPVMVRKDIEEKLSIAKANGCTVAMYLKDLSTVAYEPQRLTEWNNIAKECAEKYT